MKQIQIINEKQEYLNCSDAIESWKMNDVGFEYHVVAVFGAQSSGKSTLLNHLFSTQFDVMNAQGGRGQTTKGIWMSKDPNRDILIMDVEGTDGRERGEDQDFERKSALFSLAIAEILIINMFEQSVGLYNGANMSLLRTVLEVNLQLFQVDSTSKTCLLFVLRDSTGQTPVETLANSLRTDLEKMWMSLSKPIGKETALISDYFDFSFAAIAHKVFVPEKFDSDLQILKTRFVDNDNPDFLFRPKYHKGIPADGFPMFARNIWDKIITNRDLDLPSQQQLLAQFRCDEISDSIFLEFLEKVQVLNPILDSGKVALDFGEIGTRSFSSCIESFKKNASRYHSPTYEKKKIEFSQRLYSNLHLLFLQQLRNLHQDALEFLLNNLKNDDVDKNFSSQLESSRKKTLDYYIGICNSSKLAGSDWKFDDILSSFIKEIDSIITQKRTDEIKKANTLIHKKMTSKYMDEVPLLFSSDTDELWKNVFSLFSSVLSDSLEDINLRMTDIGVAHDEILPNLVLIKFQVWHELIRSINEELTDVSLFEKMRRRFNSIFKYDDNGLPRIWSPADNIESIFQRAKLVVGQMVSRFEYFELNLDDLDKDILNHEDFNKNDLRFVSISRKTSIMERFSKEEDTLFLEAKRATVASKAEIPTWFLGLTILLGWNEFLAILRNPLLTLVLVMVIGGFYLIYYTQMGDPAIKIVKATANEIFKQIKEELKKRGMDSQSLHEKVKDFLIYDETEGNSNIEMKKL